MKRNDNKIRTIKVKGKTGEFKFTYKPTPSDDEDEKLLCELYCPYDKICDKIRDPRDIDDPDRNFSDFCGELGQDSEDDKEDEILKNFVPVNLEESFKDYPDIFSQIIDKDPVVRLKKVIKCVCSGWCSDFDENFSKCKYENKSCILHELFSKE